MKDLIFKTEVAGYEISLTKLENGRFLVKYGCSEYIYTGTDLTFNKLAYCIRHALECEGKLD